MCRTAAWLAPLSVAKRMGTGPGDDGGDIAPREMGTELSEPPACKSNDDSTQKLSYRKQSALTS